MPMMDRLTICAEICRRVGISNRVNPYRTLLSKREMISIWRRLIAQDLTIERLSKQVERLQKSESDQLAK